jgi:uncharacterized protein (TIGR00730 family)
MTICRVCVFCGSSPGAGPDYLAAAEALGEEMLNRNFDLVYGGAGVGLMGRIADTVLAGGGNVVGVMPTTLVDREVAHPGLSDLRIVKSMHERKALMADLADAFVAMPGGLGTVEELLEALTLAQLGMHRKPCGVLNVGGYFDNLKAFLDTATERHFVDPNHRNLLVDSEDPGVLLDLLESFEFDHIDKARWIHHMNSNQGKTP